MAHASVYDLFRSHAKGEPGRVAVLAKRAGFYEPHTWAALDERVDALARGLLALGLEPGDRVCIVAETSLEWVIFDLAILRAGGVTVPIYTAESAPGCQLIVSDSGAAIVVAEDLAQVRKLWREKSGLAGVRHVVQVRGEPEAGDPWVLPLAELERRGVGRQAELEARSGASGRDDPATIIYTAGTTGRPKGVVLTHANLLYEADAVSQIGIAGRDDTQLLYLPLAHALGRVLVVSWLATGHVLAFAESPRAVMTNLLEVRPTFMAAVPRFYERVYATIARRALEAGVFTTRLFAQAVALSVRRGEAESHFEHLGMAERLRLAALQPLVFDRIAMGLKQAMGGNMRLMISGGAPLSARIAWMLRDAGLDVLEGYGLAETSAATTVNRPGSWRIGSVGTPVPGTHLRVGGDGEILVKGPGVMREYWRNAEATREALDEDGWLHTGDIGVLDGSGFLHITDRKKDLIVTAGGKNVAPQKLENLLQSNPIVSHAVVHGDRRKFLSALITLEDGALRALGAELGFANASYAELSQKIEVLRRVEAMVEAFNDQLPGFEAIRRFKILEHDFTVDAGELTPSLKVRRRVINTRYARIFDSFYDEPLP